MQQRRKRPRQKKHSAAVSAMLQQALAHPSQALREWAKQALAEEAAKGGQERPRK